MQREVPAGQLRLGTGEQTVRTVVDAASAAELSALEIPLPDGRRTRLDEVAHVGEGSAERRSGAFLDGRPVVGFDIVRSRNAGDLDVARGVRAALRELQAERPDLRFTETFNSVDAVRENYLGSLSLLLEGALLAVVIVGLFLRDLRATLISGAALPLSVMPTFLAMHALGFSLNIITLLALSLVVGILVDDAIVEIENIMRHQGEGRAPRDAAREAAAEIGLAVIATTFALVAVFLPTAFMDGLAGRFFRQFDWTAAIAVFVSLLVARLLTPMMAANLLRPSSPPQAEPFWMPAYLAAARWAFTHRRSTLALAAAFAVAGCLPLAAGMVKTDFMPPEDHGQTRIKIELPPGSRWEQTHAVALQAWQLIAGHPHVRQVFAGVGADGEPPTSQAPCRKHARRPWSCP